MWKIYLVIAALFSIQTLSSCEGDDNSGPPVDNSPIVGNDAAQYMETDEAGNSTRTTPESTSYTVDTKGIVINGSTEASSPSSDFYKFNTGTFTKLTVAVYVNNVKDTQENHKTSISLDAVENDGYSSLMGNGFFIRAQIFPGKEYLISVGGTAGITYRMEMKGEL